MFSIASKISFSRRSLSFGVIVIISITTSIILFANVEAREHYSHWIISITASVTAILAISILFQQKRYHDLIERADLALAIALGLSLSAEILWAIYEIILDVVPPVPSLADVLSLSAYASLSDLKDILDSVSLLMAMSPFTYGNQTALGPIEISFFF